MPGLVRLVPDIHVAFSPPTRYPPCLKGSSVRASAKDRIVRYVSTRGEAPPLDFIDVMLAGLARDGGLYVPES